MFRFLRTESGQKKGCLLLLIAFTIYFTVLGWPLGFAIQFSLLLLTCLFLKVRWWLPCSIAGSYVGLLNPLSLIIRPVQPEEWACGVLFMALIGFIIGVAIDKKSEQSYDPKITSKDKHS